MKYKVGEKVELNELFYLTFNWDSLKHISISTQGEILECHENEIDTPYYLTTLFAGGINEIYLEKIIDIDKMLTLLKI